MTGAETNSFTQTNDEFLRGFRHISNLKTQYFSTVDVNIL